MKRKALIILTIVTIISLFSISYTFAANNLMGDMTNGVRNFVGGAENMIEGAGSAMGRTIQNGVDTMRNTAENTMGTNTGDDDNSEYTATRTATGTTDTASGMSTSTYTWVIIGVTAVAIGVLLWSYFAHSKDNMYIDSNDR